MNNNINISYIDGIRFHRALASGIHNVISRQEYLNKINVFPVPDSDTGTNMAFTLNAVLNGTSTKVCNSISFKGLFVFIKMVLIKIFVNNLNLITTNFSRIS